MIERELLDSADIPGGAKLRLFRREMKHGAEYSIALGANELMNSRLSASEEALATFACQRLSDANPHILIGGYGMGFTLRAALEVLPQNAVIEVIELVPDILDWAKGPMAELTAGCLDDPRVEISIGDVADIIAGSGNRYDVILLDVDNGPDGITTEQNDRLYGLKGLAKTKESLRSKGILAVWSSTKDERFTKRLNQSGFSVTEEAVNARPNGKGARHNIWLASKT